MKNVMKCLLLFVVMTTKVFAGTGEISIGGHCNNGTGANIGYTRILDSKWLWSLNIDYGLMNLEVMDGEYEEYSFKTNATVGLIEYKFEIGKAYEINPTLNWKWITGAGVALLDGTLEGMPGKDMYMWAIPVEAHLIRYTDETKDFGFFAGFTLTARMAMHTELYNEINIVTPQLRSGIVF